MCSFVRCAYILTISKDLWPGQNLSNSLSRVEKCYIPGAIEKALRRAEVCSAFEILDRVWKGVLEGKEDIANFKKALEQWKVTFLSNLKEFT